MIVALALAAPALAASESDRLDRGDIVVVVSKGAPARSARIHAVADIPASAHLVWRLMRDCANAPRLVAFVKACRVTDADAAGAWDVREELIDYGVLFPKVKALFRSDYEEDQLIHARCLPQSEMKVCDTEWRLGPGANGATRLSYDSLIVSPFAVPEGLMRWRLRRDIERALRALRRQAAVGA
jgi:hypothetical protein